MEALARLQAEYGEDTFAVILLPTDPTVTGEEMDAILRNDFLIPGVERFVHCLDPSGKTVLSLDPIGVGGTVIVDREGRVSFKGRLTHEYDEIKTEIERVK